MAKTNPPVLHLVEDAEKAFLHTLRTFSPPFFPNDRESIMDSCRAFQDRLRALGINTKEIERRRLKVLCSAYDSQTAIGIDIDLTMETPSADPQPSIRKITAHGQQALLGPGAGIPLTEMIDAAVQNRRELGEPTGLFAVNTRARDRFVYHEERRRRRRAAKKVQNPARHVGVSDPKALRDAYLSSFAEKVTVLDICWAAKQHYREWIRWTGGKLKQGSKPDMAFRAILTSGKRPEVYRAEPRPKGWK